MTRKDGMILGSVCLVAGMGFATATPVQADIIFFTSQVDFELALQNAGKVLKGKENYPWEAGPGGVIGVPNPLDWTTSVPGWIQPGVLLDNITYQANANPFGAGGPNPGQEPGLALFTTGFNVAIEDGLVANFFVESFDILSGPPAGDNHTAMGLQVISFNSSPAGSSVTISVYDKDENLVGQLGNVSAPAGQGGTFIGILSTGGETIGRVNLYDTNPGFDAEGLYNLSVYVPAPGSLALLGLAGLFGRRRRRS